MQRLFEMTKSGLEITPQALAINEFKKVWEKDKTKVKGKAIGALAFIYYFSDVKSPYARFSDHTEREKKIAQDLFENAPDWRPDKDIKDACRKYEELHTTTSMLLLRDASSAVSKLRTYFRTVDLTEKDPKTGKPIYSAKDLMSNLKQVGDVIKGLKDLEKEVNKDIMEDNSKIKGGGRVGMFEDPPD